MRRSPSPGTLLLVLLALCAAARVAPGQQAAAKFEWREFRSEAGGFSVKFPSEPRVTPVPFVKGPFTFTRHAHTAEAGAGAYEFEVDYIDLPAGYDEPELSLEGGIVGFVRHVESSGGRMLTNTKVVRGTCEGRDATGSMPSGAGKPRFAQARVYNSGQRFYFAIFSAREDTEAARAVGRAFFDSFDVRDGCKAPVAATPAPTGAPVRGTVEGTRDPATGWRRIDMPDLGFSVLMPGPAQRESTHVQVQPFPLHHHEFVFETADVIYTAEAVGDYPVGFYSNAEAYENLLDVTLIVIKRTLGEMEFEYGEPRKFSAGGYPAREYAIRSGKTGTRGRLRLYATPRRAYIFTALAATPRDAEIERFISSVRVTPK